MPDDPKLDIERLYRALERRPTRFQISLNISRAICSGLLRIALIVALFYVGGRINSLRTDLNRQFSESTSATRRLGNEINLLR